MKYNVLVVDDEIDICETIQDVISACPSVEKVHIATSADQALETIDKNEVHLIISDILMPKMNGLEFLKALRQKRFKYPVVFVSASDSDESLIKALEYGAADFISKPFDAKELEVLVNRLLATVAAIAA